jgi:hypothetical protein
MSQELQIPEDELGEEIIRALDDVACRIESESQAETISDGEGKK